MKSVFVIDTSSLLELHHIPEDIFPSIWKELDKLIDAGELVAPHEVRREVEKGQDEIVKWAKSHSHLFKMLDVEQGRHLGTVIQDFPTMAGASHTGPFADPLVVALAMSLKSASGSSPVVVTEEVPRGPGSTKIPNLCQRYGISCVNLHGLLRVRRIRL